MPTEVAPPAVSVYCTYAVMAVSETKVTVPRSGLKLAPPVAVPSSAISTSPRACPFGERSFTRG
ncbi:hypothetical protein ACFPRL_08870 [Pseudoclavibacter helvolus]